MEAFCVGTFLALYLNAKLKACSDYHTSLWKLIVVLSPIAGAAFIAASVGVDHVGALLFFSSNVMPSLKSTMNNDAWLVDAPFSQITTSANETWYLLTVVLLHQNHHFQDVLLSIPLGVLIGLLAYRTHYVSLFNYHTNHLYLPWSSLHRSTNLTAPTVPIARDAKPGYRFKSKYRHKTAVAWPRRPESQGWDRGQETGTVGLDGSGDGKTGRSRRSRPPRTLKRGIMRQSMFPVRRERSIDGVRSRDNISSITEGPPLMTPATRAAEHSTPPGPPDSAATSRYYDPPERGVTPIMTPATRAAQYSPPQPKPNSAATSHYFDCPGRGVTPIMTPNTRTSGYLTPRGPPNSATTSRYFESSRRDVPSAGTPNSGSPGRVAVDDWAHGGRPSDMV